MLKIVDWDENFENNRTRELIKMRWVPFKNSFDTDGFVELMDHPHGMAHFGAWVLIVEVASRCKPRGTLIRSNGKDPHTAVSISRITRGEVKAIQEAIPRLIKIGWLEESDSNTISQDTAGKSQDTDYGKEGKEKKEKKERPIRNIIPPNLEWVQKYCADRKNGLDAQAFVDHYTARGWKYKAGSPVVDWQACIRTWEKNRISQGFTPSVGKTQPPMQNIKPGDL